MGKARLWDMIRNLRFVAKLAGEGTPGVVYQEVGSLLVCCLPMVPGRDHRETLPGTSFWFPDFFFWLQKSQGRIQDFHWGGVAGPGAPFLLAEGAPYLLGGRCYGENVSICAT